jgi:hypothetical protein
MLRLRFNEEGDGKHIRMISKGLTFCLMSTYSCTLVYFYDLKGLMAALPPRRM